jgi:hypothetical protein
LVIYRLPLRNAQRVCRSRFVVKTAPVLLEIFSF